MRILTIATLALFMALPSHAKNLYVHQEHASASDATTYADNTASLPWLTIAKGMDEALAGDTLIIQGGPYTGIIDLNFTASGTSSDNQITMKGETPSVQIVGQATSADGVTHGILNLADVNWITIEDLTFKQGGMCGIVLGDSGAVTNITVQTCDLSGVDHRSNDNPAEIYMGVEVSDVIVSNNYIHDTISGHGIYMSTCEGDVTLSDNHIRDLLMAGAIDWPVGIWAKHQLQSVATVENNVIHGAAFGWRGNVKNSFLTNNLIFDMTEWGIWTPGTGGGVEEFTANNVKKNSLLHCALGGVYFGRPVDPGLGSSGNTLHDNLIYNCGKASEGSENTPYDLWAYYAGVLPLDNDSDYNLYYAYGKSNIMRYLTTPKTLAEFNALTGLDAHSVDGEPVFTTPYSADNVLADFELAAGSPGKGAASDASDMGVDISEIDAPWPVSAEAITTGNGPFNLGLGISL